MPTQSIHPAIAANLDPDRPLPYNCVNYSDDMAGCEHSLHKAHASFESLGKLLGELDLEESSEKACTPSTCMVFLGVEFDSEKLIMRVPGETIQELRSELCVWERRTTFTRRKLQSIIGKLFWVSKMVTHRRPFIGRLLQQLRDTQGTPDSKRTPLSSESKKDILWWSQYMRTFNGVNAIVNDEDNRQPLELLISTSYKVYVGDGGWRMVGG